MTGLDVLPPRGVLYYPTINIPSGKWLRYSLLYWDNVGSIVPEESHDIFKFSPDIQYLRSEGIFTSYPPYLAFESQENKLSLYQEFKTIVTSKDFQSKLPPFEQRRCDHLVYREKVLDSIFYLLKKNNLAEFYQNEPYYHFERNAFYVYMSILARHICLGTNQPGVLVPGTDMKVYEDMVFKTDSIKKGIPSLITYLDKILPLPADDTPLEDIISFRIRRKDELIRFRLLINDFQNQIQASQSQLEIREILLGYKERIVVDLFDLQRALRSDKINLVFTSISSIITFQFGDLLRNKFDPIALSLPALMGSIVIGYCLLKKFRDEEIISKSPVSYLLHVREEMTNS